MATCGAAGAWGVSIVAAGALGSALGGDGGGVAGAIRVTSGGAGGDGVVDGAGLADGFGVAAGAGVGVGAVVAVTLVVFVGAVVDPADVGAGSAAAGFDDSFGAEGAAAGWGVGGATASLGCGGGTGVDATVVGAVGSAGDAAFGAGGLDASIVGGLCRPVLAVGALKTTVPTLA